MSTFDYVILFIMGFVLFVLISGLVVMSIGGETNKKYGNKLMMVRVGSQALVVLLLGMLFLFSK